MGENNSVLLLASGPLFGDFLSKNIFPLEEWKFILFFLELPLLRKV